jgi:hypothetical protein
MKPDGLVVATECISPCILHAEVYAVSPFPYTTGLLRWMSGPTVKYLAGAERVPARIETDPSRTIVQK